MFQVPFPNLNMGVADRVRRDRLYDISPTQGHGARKLDQIENLRRAVEPSAR
jgi:hypothetical protein